MGYAIMSVAKSRTDLFREYAAECDKQKRRASDLQVKASWEMLQRQWLELADMLERSDKKQAD